MKIDAVVGGEIIDSSNEKFLQPIIVNFQNGELKENETENMMSCLYSDERCGETVLALSNGKIVYKGYRPSLDKEPMCTMLAIHKKRTGTIKLVRAERWDVAPVLDRNLNYDQSLEIDKIATLNKQFGSKKVKRRTELHEKMRISGESVKDLLEKTVSNIQVEKVNESDNEEPLSNPILPPCNRDAKNVEDVYDINDIVPTDVLKTLYNVDMETVENDIEGKSKFFMQALEAVKRHSNPEEKKAALLYIEAVLSWLKLPIKGAKKYGTEVCPFSTQVNEYVIEKYSVNNVNGRLRPNSMKDRGIVHCMILALAICNYSLDLEIFASEIGGRISLKKLSEFARTIGAVPSKDNKKIVVLKLPLPPPSSLGRKKARK